MFYGSYEFSPVPLFTWTTELVKSEQGESLSLQRTLDLQGLLLDTSSSGFPTLMEAREALHDAVTTSGQEFRITHNGIHMVSGIFPELESLAFDAGTWVQQIPYTITFSYNEEIDNKAVENFSETWDFEESEDRLSFTASHTVQAVGVNTAVSGNTNAIENARNFVLQRTGYDKVPVSHPAFVQGSGVPLVAYEELRSENIDVQAGSFSVTENFTISSGAFTHTQNANFQTNEQGVTTVQIDGSIQGLGRGDMRFARALDAYNNNVEPYLQGKASQIYSQFGGSGTLFAGSPKSLSLSQTEALGTISYTRTYDDDASSDLPADIQDASVSVQTSEPVKHHATIAIPDRTSGPIVQDIGTTTPGTYTITGNITGKTGVDIEVVKAYAQQKINENLPDTTTLSAQTLIITQKSVTIDELRRTVSFNLVWQYTSSKYASDGGQIISCGI
jgi:hypothetical protein